MFKDRKATYTATVVERLLGRGGAVPVGQTTASEFGGLNVSVTKLNGVTHNPWQHGRTVGGSSGRVRRRGVGWPGDAGDRRRRRRIDPHPRGLHRAARHEGHVRPDPPRPARVHAPEHRRARQPRPVGARRGALLRRVRRLPRRPTRRACRSTRGTRPASAPTTSRASASRSSPNLGGVTLEPGVEAHLRAEAEALIASTGMVLVDVDVELPNLAAQWMMGNLATLLADLGDRWPGCATDMTPRSPPACTCRSRSTTCARRRSPRSCASRPTR